MLKDLLDEMKAIATGKTLDAMIPPLLYLIVEKSVSLELAAAVSIAAAAMLMGYRVILRHSWQYAFAGFLGVFVAAGFALLADSAVNYYVPDLISSILFAVLAAITLMIRKPMAAWLSHITRGWPLEWFWRSDVQPAYSEVTLLWLLLFIARALLLFVLLQDNNLTGLFLANTLLGLPATLVFLALSYIYGIWRLRQLGGPGVDEFKAQKPQPWKGQTKGF